MGRFKKGLFLGSLLGAGVVWLNTTKKGRETKDKILDHAAVVYSKALQQARDSGALDKLTKQKYVKIVREIVDKYAIQNDLAANVKSMVVKVVGSQWSNVQKEIKKRKK